MSVLNALRCSCGVLRTLTGVSGFFNGFGGTNLSAAAGLPVSGHGRRGPNS